MVDIGLARAVVDLLQRSSDGITKSTDVDLLQRSSGGETISTSSTPLRRSSGRKNKSKGGNLLPICAGRLVSLLRSCQGMGVADAQLLATASHTLLVHIQGGHISWSAAVHALGVYAAATRTTTTNAEAGAASATVAPAAPAPNTLAISELLKVVVPELGKLGKADLMLMGEAAAALAAAGLPDAPRARSFVDAVRKVAQAKNMLSVLELVEHVG